MNLPATCAFPHVEHTYTNMPCMPHVLSDPHVATYTGTSVCCIIEDFHRVSISCVSACTYTQRTLEQDLVRGSPSISQGRTAAKVGITTLCGRQCKPSVHAVVKMYKTDHRQGTATVKFWRGKERQQCKERPPDQRTRAHF